jgi:hypothetical protein
MLLESNKTMTHLPIDESPFRKRLWRFPLLRRRNAGLRPYHLLEPPHFIAAKRESDDGHPLQNGAVSSGATLASRSLKVDCT